MTAWIYDTSPNDTSSTTTLRLKFSSHGHFVEMPLSQAQLCRKRHLVEISPLVSNVKINRRRCLSVVYRVIVEIVGDNRIIVQIRIIPSG